MRLTVESITYKLRNEVRGMISLPGVSICSVCDRDGEELEYQVLLSVCWFDQLPLLCTLPNTNTFTFPETSVFRSCRSDYTSVSVTVNSYFPVVKYLEDCS